MARLRADADERQAEQDRRDGEPRATVRRLIRNVQNAARDNDDVADRVATEIIEQLVAMIERSFNDPCTPDACCATGQPCEHHAPLHTGGAQAGQRSEPRQHLAPEGEMTNPRVTLTIDSTGHVVVEGTSSRADSLMLARGAVGGAWRDESEILDHYGVTKEQLDVLSALSSDVSDW